MVRIAIDCMGGDHGLSTTIPAVVQMARRYDDVVFLLFGQASAIEAALRQAKAPDMARFEIHHTDESIAMDDTLEVALRRKRQSSMHLALKAVREGQAQACVSAGNTGALMAVARFMLKTMPGIDRPAIATYLPNAQGKGTLVLDLGANVDCTPDHLVQFAVMGTALVQAVDGIEQPTVGLLNIGAEAIKGNAVVKQTAELLAQTRLHFVGNIEGDDIFAGRVHVVVCDGFVGNVLLKSVEGLAKFIAQRLKQSFQHNWYHRLAGVLSLPVLRRFRQQIDNRRYNGAALLGLQGVVFKSHGGADAFAFAHAIEKTRLAVLSQLQQQTQDAVQATMESLLIGQVTTEVSAPNAVAPDASSHPPSP